MSRIFKKKPFFLVRVTGESGWPHLVSGRTHLATSIRRPRIGDFVVFPNPRNQDDIFVKRVRAITPDGYEVESSVSWGSSSENFGLVAPRELLGTIWKIR